MLNLSWHWHLISLVAVASKEWHNQHKGKDADQCLLLLVTSLEHSWMQHVAETPSSTWVAFIMMLIIISTPLNLGRKTLSDSTWLSNLLRIVIKLPGHDLEQQRLQPLRFAIHATQSCTPQETQPLIFLIIQLTVIGHHTSEGHELQKPHKFTNMPLMHQRAAKQWGFPNKKLNWKGSLENRRNLARDTRN